MLQRDIHSIFFQLPVFYDHPHSYTFLNMLLMFEQVNNEIWGFLDRLSYIYKSNGIVHPIKDFHKAILRMVAPIQLLHQTTQNRDEYESAIQKFQQRINDQKFQNPFIETTQSQPIMKPAFTFCVRNQSLAQRGRGRRAIHFGSQNQRQIQQWALDLAKKGYLIEKRKIIKKGMAIAKLKGLKIHEFDGWYYRFIRRHKTLQNVIQYQKQIRERGLNEDDDDYQPHQRSIQQRKSIIQEKINKINEQDEFEEVINPKRKATGWNYQNYKEFSTPLYYGKFAQFSNESLKNEDKQ